MIYSLGCDYNGFILVGPLFTSSFVLVHSVVITMVELLGLAETIARSKWLQLTGRCLSAPAAPRCLQHRGCHFNSKAGRGARRGPERGKELGRNVVVIHSFLSK